MSKQPVDENGAPTSLWTSLADAKRHRAPHYDCGGKCPECLRRGGLESTPIAMRKRYVATGECVQCAYVENLELLSLATYSAALNQLPDGGYEYVLASQEAGAGRPVSEKYVERMTTALELWQGAVPTTKNGAVNCGEPFYLREVTCRTHGHLGVTSLKGDCYYCAERKNKLSSRQKAVRDGLKWYLPEEPCKNCGQHAEKRVDNGQCRGCGGSASAALSPRQEAIKAGAKWYLPVDSCPKCGQHAEKRVDNGQCRGCASNPAGDRRTTPDSVMMNECLDLVISRADARSTGLGVYRTGEACPNGHTGYRYVSTGGCIDCLRA